MSQSPTRPLIGSASSVQVQDGEVRGAQEVDAKMPSRHKVEGCVLEEAAKEDLQGQKAAEDDLAYIMYYPRGLKYHALFVNGDGNDLSRLRRATCRGAP